jgi:hypothetical protein
VSAVGRETFAGSGVVGRYWQTRCCGFEVRSPRGRRLGLVEAIDVDQDTAAATRIVLRSPRGRPVSVDVGCVEVVDPWRCTLVVALPRRRRVSAAGGTVVRGATRGAASLRLTAVRAAGAARNEAPRAARFLLVTTRGTARAGRRFSGSAAGALRSGASGGAHAARGGSRRLSLAARRSAPPVASTLRAATRHAAVWLGMAAWLYGALVASFVRLLVRLLARPAAAAVRGVETAVQAVGRLRRPTPPLGGGTMRLRLGRSSRWTRAMRP